MVLLETIGLSFLIGLAPPLRSLWYVTVLGLLLLAAYVWVLLWIKQRGPEAEMLERNRVVKIPEAAPAPAPAKYVADASSRTPRAAYNGLTVDADDLVNIVVKPARNVRVAGV